MPWLERKDPFVIAKVPYCYNFLLTKAYGSEYNIIIYTKTILKNNLWRRVQI